MGCPPLSPQPPDRPSPDAARAAVSVIDRFACALGDHHWWLRLTGDMACQWCGLRREPSEAEFDDRGRWRWPDDDDGLEEVA